MRGCNSLVSIGYDGVRETVKSEYLFKEIIRCADCRIRIFGGYEMHVARKPIDNCGDGSKSRGSFEQVSDKV